MGFLCFLYIQLYPYCSMLAHAHRRNLFENWKTGKINSDCNLSLSFITTHLSLQDLNMPLFMSIQQLQQRIWTIWLNQPVISYTVMDVSWILDCGTHDAGDEKNVIAADGNCHAWLVGGWEHEFYDFPSIENVIIPSDFHIFQRVQTTNQIWFIRFIDVDCRSTTNQTMMEKRLT